MRRQERINQVNAIGEIHNEFLHHLEAHIGSFPPIHKPTAEIASSEIAQRVQLAERAAITGISILKRSQRKEARASAAANARAQVETERAQKQRDIDEAWSRLLANDPETVLATIEAAFHDNEAPAAPLDCHDDTVTLLLRYPPLNAVVPTHYPDLTPTGRPTIRQRSQTDRNQLHLEGLLSHAYATVAETFAVAPSISRATIITVLADDRSFAPVYCATTTRTGLASWLRAGRPVPAPGCLLNVRGRTAEVSPLDLRSEPALAQVTVRLSKDLGLAVAMPS